MCDKVKLEIYYKLQSTQNKINLSLQKSVINSHVYFLFSCSVSNSIKYLYSAWRNWICLKSKDFLSERDKIEKYLKTPKRCFVKNEEITENTQFNK